MILESALYRHLSTHPDVVALAGDRGHPFKVPKDEIMPCWAYQRITSPELMDHDGIAKLEHPRIQITCHAESYDGAISLARTIRKVMRGFKGMLGGPNGVIVDGVFIFSQWDGYGPAANVHTTRLDLEIWHKTGGPFQVGFSQVGLDYIGA